LPERGAGSDDFGGNSECADQVDWHTNPHNVIKATFAALRSLKSRESVAAMRGKSMQEI